MKTKRCKHENTKTYLLGGRRTSKFKRCADCGEQLPINPTPDVELDLGANE